MSLAQTYTEKEIIDGCSRGERKCQEALYRRFSQKMYNVCLGYARDRDEAKDFLQESFIKIFDNIHKYDFKGSLEGWIRRIVVNTSIDHYRKNNQLKKLYIESSEESDSEKQIDNTALKTFDGENFLSLLQVLPAGYRMVLNLYIVEEYSHKEIAEMLNISEGTSKSQLSKAKTYLQKIIEENHHFYQILKMNHYGN